MLAGTVLVSFQHRFYKMCYNTIRRHCCEVLHPKCAMPTDTIGIHYKYFEHRHCEH